MKVETVDAEVNLFLKLSRHELSVLPGALRRLVMSSTDVGGVEDREVASSLAEALEAARKLLSSRLYP